MKRFWREAAAAPAEIGGFAIRVDGKSVQTPARNPLIIPTESLATAIAAEWNMVEGQINPRAMPLTGLANAAIDRIAPDPAAFADTLAAYAETDLACYRAEGPRSLVECQEREWDALIDWARRRFDVDFKITCSILHVAQPRATVDRLAHEVRAQGPFTLAGLAPLVTLGGSLIVALAVLDSAIGAEQAWEAVSVDDRWQAEKWGRDTEAEAALGARRSDFLAAARFLDLLG